MKNWNDVKKLHIEISSKCNAVCPMCPRYPTSSYYVHPFIQDDWMWNIDTVKQRLPAQDLVGITDYLINGNIGDFIMNSDAIKIVQYLNNCSPLAGILINTNGSARNAEWWRSLASIPNVVVNFALDGLEDTHTLYRRNTNWSKIINNAKTFIEAGGCADWTMIVFEHNKHQIDECRSLSKSLGFKSFQYRNSDRTNTVAVDKTGLFGYPVISPDLNIPKKKYIQLLIMEQDLKNLNKGIQTPAPKAPDTKPLPNLETCQSISSKSIYIGSDWAVMPCCFFGGLTVVKQSDYRWNNFKSELDSNGFNINDFYASDTKTVREVFEQGFDWIYNKITTDDVLVTCYANCHPKDSAYIRSSNDFQRIDFAKGLVPPV